jgi:hypothetical protein
VQSDIYIFLQWLLGFLPCLRQICCSSFPNCYHKWKNRYSLRIHLTCTQLLQHKLPSSSLPPGWIHHRNTGPSVLWLELAMGHRWNMIFRAWVSRRWLLFRSISKQNDIWAHPEVPRTLRFHLFHSIY